MEVLSGWVIDEIVEFFYIPWWRMIIYAYLGHLMWLFFRRLFGPIPQRRH